MNIQTQVDESPHPGRDFFYKKEIARALGVSQDNINLLTLEAFDLGESRFLFGFTDDTPHTSLETGFIKIASEEKYKSQLRREVRSMELAAAIGIPTIPVHNGYVESAMGFGIIKLKKLNIEQGYLLATDELIAAASQDNQYGSRAARLISSTIGKIIPQNIDSSFLIRGQRRIDSHQSFGDLWGEMKDIVLDPHRADFRDRLIGKKELLEILDQAINDLDPIILSGASEEEFFVHNDTSPSNCFFANGKGQGRSDVLLDFEQSAATHNLVLAAITDISDFYNRAWPNPDMQQEYLCTLLLELQQFPLNDRHHIIRGAAIFGTMFASQFYMDADHPRNSKAEALLANLKQNLRVLDAAFDKIH